MKVIGSILILLALAVAIVPRFTDCQSQGKAIVLSDGKTIPMKCHWTGVAELATAGPLVVLGGIMTVSRHKQTLRALAILGIVLGIFVILLPAQLIGVCASAEMLCNMVMRPSLMFAGVLVVATSVVVLLAARGPETQTLISG